MQVVNGLELALAMLFGAVLGEGIRSKFIDKAPFNSSNVTRTLLVSYGLVIFGMVLLKTVLLRK